MPEAARWLERINALELPGLVRVLNVCGGHERTIGMAGIRGVLPDGIELIPGPGCPVCVCPEEDILSAIQLASSANVILVAFGDMLRVPANVARGELRSLVEARASGADVRAVASPLDAVAVARANPGRQVVFFVAGFETTAAPVAAMLREGPPDNLSLLLAARRTWPAVAMLLQSQQPGFEGLIAPGHVATVMGADEWRFVVDRHGMPAAVAGFTPASILEALYSVLRQIIEARPFLDNCYKMFVRDTGNLAAQACLAEQFDDSDGAWRGIGTIPHSGYRLRQEFAAHDAEKLFDVADILTLEPEICISGEILRGIKKPHDCPAFATLCDPQHPLGATMVSAEGACAAYYAYGRHLKPQGAGKLHQIAPDLAPASAGAALVSGGRA